MLSLIDKWLHDPAIRRAALLALLAFLATLILITALGGPLALSFLISPPLASATGLVALRRTHTNKT